MSFLGGFLLGESIRFGITWVPAPGEPGISGSSLTLTHDDGTTLGPLAATGAANDWLVVTEPTKRGGWHVAWTSTPEGGITNDAIYVS